MSAKIRALLTEIRACRLCEAHLPLGPRPVLVPKPRARIAIAIGAPIVVPRDGDAVTIETGRMRLQQALEALESRTLQILHTPR